MGLLNTISNVIGKNVEQVSKVYLVELDPNSDEPKSDTMQAFQYWPETITDSRSVDYRQQNPVGSSHPLYQWLHGSPRSIRFDAIFVNEDNDTPQDALTNIGATVSSIVRNPLAGTIGLLGKKKQGGSVDVAGAVAWLRAKTYPSYTKTKAIPPPKLLLWAENSGLTSFVGPHELDVIPCVMTECTVTYEGFFRNGTPRVATVSLAFDEIIQLGSQWKYVDGKNVSRAWRDVYVFGDKKAVPFRKAGGSGSTDPNDILGAVNKLIGNALGAVRNATGGRIG